MIPRLSFERRIRIAFGIGVAIVALVGAASLRSTAATVDSALGVAHTLQVRAQLEATFGKLIAAESGVRGYVITGDTTYLAPYRWVRATLDSSLADLRALTADNPAQQRHLDSLAKVVAVRMERFQWSIDTRRTGGAATAGRAVIGGRGKELIAVIRSLIGQMEDEEARLLAQRFRAMESRARLARVTAWGGSLLALMVGILAPVLVGRELRARRQAEERLRHMVDSVRDYAIYMLDPTGRVVSWNRGAEQTKGYRAAEIVGQHFSRFFTPEDVAAGRPAALLQAAAADGRYEEENWRVRKDGSRFWADVVVSAVRDERGTLVGFAKVTRDLTERKRAAEEMQRSATQLEAANRELEAFAYSVSHDLRAPLRTMDGFSQALLEDYADRLDDPGRDFLERIRVASQRMARLIDDLLGLSRVTRSDMQLADVNLSKLADQVAGELQKTEPDRRVTWTIAPGLVARADAGLLRLVLQNLLGNAWKFTAKRPAAHVEFGATSHNGRKAYFVRDDGAGFDMAYADKLFGAFQRLHGIAEFPGTGVGLATVQRIIHRHGGEVWAEAAVDQGATFYFTL
ncbi:MAG TPA: CHASE3 domain-containing protein [Gemmatimonadales bacterium]|nr:CHASE3 domain-containing protein [Gemmatimonadales bacterium]